MPGIFITGTDTEVGKTQIGAALAHLLAKQGIPVRPRKPVESGCVSSSDTALVPQDALALKTASNSDDSLEVICPYQFKPAISPERAATQAGKLITLNDLEQACLSNINPEDFLLVEAAGGFYSPLAQQIRCADLALCLKLPVLLVVADRLGCINHTLLSVQAINNAGLELLAVVLNKAQTTNETEMNNYADLKQWLDCPLIPVQRKPESAEPWKSIAADSTPFRTFVTNQLSG